MNEFWYRIRRGAMYTASLLPFKVLYAISDLIYFIAYHIIRYRRRVVAKNLRNSFPEKGADELRAIEKRFYHSFCDSVVEMFKLLSISREELMRRMSFSDFLNAVVVQPRKALRTALPPHAQPVLQPSFP